MREKIDIVRNSFFSKKVVFLNVIATILIVVLHAETPIRFGQDLALEPHPFIYSVYIFTQTAIPLFFFISGLLFYRSCEWGDIPNKLKRRFFSLVVPFIIWNVIFVFIYWVLRQMPFTASRMNLVDALDTPRQWLLAVWHTKFTPLWFVKYLIIFCLFSPTVLLVIKNKWIGLVATISLFAVSIILKWDSYCNLFYWMPEYLSGALIGRYLCKPTTDEDSRMCDGWSVNRKSVCRVILIVLFIVAYLITLFNTSDLKLMIFRFVTPIIIWFLTDLLLPSDFKDTFTVRDWMGYTFFIYATHHFLLNVEQTLVRAYLPSTPLVLNLTFIVTPIVTLLIIIWIARLLSRFKFYKVLTGGR